MHRENKALPHRYTISECKVALHGIMHIAKSNKDLPSYARLFLCNLAGIDSRLGVFGPENTTSVWRVIMFRTIFRTIVPFFEIISLQNHHSNAFTGHGGTTFVFVQTMLVIFRTSFRKTKLRARNKFQSIDKSIQMFISRNMSANSCCGCICNFFRMPDAASQGSQRY